jgi:hypothetical protein
MKTVTGRSAVTLELLETLGLKAQSCFSLDFHFSVNELATVTVGLNLSEETVTELIKVMKMYKLIPVGDIP